MSATRLPSNSAGNVNNSTTKLPPLEGEQGSSTTPKSSVFGFGKIKFSFPTFSSFSIFKKAATQQAGAEKKFIDDGCATRMNFVGVSEEVKPVANSSTRPKDTEALPKMTVYNDSPEDRHLYTELAKTIVNLDGPTDNPKAKENAEKALDYVGKAETAFDSAKSSKKTGLAWVSVHLHAFVQNSLGRYYQAKAKTALLEAMVAADPDVQEVEQLEAQPEKERSSKNLWITVDIERANAFEKAKSTLLKATLDHKAQSLGKQEEEEVVVATSPLTVGTNESIDDASQEHIEV
ncbi:MAG: hypothetical protein ACOYK6_08530 [Chthoniobacterales bacterium]